MSQITALIDFSNPHDLSAPRLRHAFAQPRSVLIAHELAQVGPLLNAVQTAAQQGHWCVGYIRYEAAPAFDRVLMTHAPDGPLAWFAIYDEALPWPENAAGTTNAANATPATTVQAQWHASCPRPVFEAALAHIQRAIANGELYQVNFTAPLQGAWLGQLPSPSSAEAALALFSALQRAQPGGYAALIDTGAVDDLEMATDSGEQLLSVSPELFFDWQSGPALQAGQILARPMKGTAARGHTPALDAAQAANLRASAKERAENVMIVDLLRNDLSRIAQPFSVQVAHLFHTQALPSVWQMTSDVVAQTRPNTTLADVFGALFPCGSVTGAPKVQAMQLIHSLEPAPRGVYCGAIGVVRPSATLEQGIHATFNVPIRTVSVRDGQLRCGIGSGITSGAVPEAEWQEWKNKQQFLERASMPFDLLETLALENGQWRHIAEHLQRLTEAATHFGYPLNRVDVENCLQELTQLEIYRQGAWRVRLLLNAQGQARAQAFALEAAPAGVSLQLAERPLVEAHSEFVRFKTTRRAHYEAFTPTQPHVFDTVLWNTEGEITECTRGNVAMLMEGRWVTPPLACGLLAGVGRAHALKQGHLTEAVVHLNDLPRVRDWAFLNSLRGWIKACKVTE